MMKDTEKDNNPLVPPSEIDSHTLTLVLFKDTLIST